MTRILFVGDLQIGAGQAYGTPERPRLIDQQVMWSWIVSQAVAEWDVGKVVLLGDVFDKRNPTADEEIVFLGPLRRLRDAGVDVLAIAGNHDISSETAASPLQVFADLMTVHRVPQVWGPVATLPWTPPHRLAAAHGREQINERVAAHLVECARELHRGKGGFHEIRPILALHWSISGASLPTGLSTDQLAEPVLPLEDLMALGYKAIVAGHIHKAQVLAPSAPDMDEPLVLVAGSPMVNDFGEAEGDHGVWVLDTVAWEREFYPVPDRPFVTIVEDAGLPERFTEFSPYAVRDAVVRVRYTATPDQAAKIDNAAIERALYDAGAHKVYAIESTILRERRARVETMDETLEPLEALDAWMGAQGENLDADTAKSVRQYMSDALAAGGLKSW